MQKEFKEKNIKKLKLQDKIENYIQENDLLTYEINGLKNNLIAKCEKITQNILNNILVLNNPNDSIFNLMKTFFWTIISFENKIQKNIIDWDYIKKNLNHQCILNYLSFISKSNQIYLTNDDLEELMPFMTNYEKIKNIFRPISMDLILVLDFVNFFKVFIIFDNLK